MQRARDEVSYTEDDLKGCLLKKRTEEEIAKDKKAWEKKLLAPRIFTAVMVIGIIALAIFAREVFVKHISSLVAFILSFCYVLQEYTRKKNVSLLTTEYYIEVVVLDFLEIETWYYPGIENNSISFYPIIGEDTTTGYESKFYLDRDEYYLAKENETIKLSVPDKSVDLFNHKGEEQC